MLAPLCQPYHENQELACHKPSSLKLVSKFTYHQPRLLEQLMLAFCPLSWENVTTFYLNKWDF